MTPLITVIMPAYNCAATIKQSVYSVLEQTTPNLELIIIDDGCTGGRSSNKLKAAKNRWIIYREAEGLSFLASIYYLFRYFLAAMKKYKTLIKVD